MAKKTKICTFIGDSIDQFTKEKENKAKGVLIDLIENHNVVKFFCGGYGDFDTAMAYIIKELKKCYLIKSYYIMPYNNSIQQKKLNFIQKLKLYDGIVYPKFEKVPYNFALVTRNEWMIDNSDYAVAYVPYDNGVDYQSLQYAQNKISIKMI